MGSGKTLFYFVIILRLTKFSNIYRIVCGGRTGLQVSDARELIWIETSMWTSIQLQEMHGMQVDIASTTKLYVGNAALVGTVDQLRNLSRKRKRWLHCSMKTVIASKQRFSCILSPSYFCRRTVLTELYLKTMLKWYCPLYYNCSNLLPKVITFLGESYGKNCGGSQISE